MNFEPKTEMELQSEALAPDGDYNFEVLEASDETSKKSGNPMIKVNLGLYFGEAIRWRTFDYLLPAMASKLRHFCDTTGLLAKYESGQLRAVDCVGRSGKCRVIVEEDKSGQYPDKNKVSDYVVRAAKPLEKQASAEPETPDDIPF